jgi:hypothetical protein
MAPKPFDALARFEGLAERWLEGGFARLFRARFHRAELAEQLIRALEDGRTAGPDGVWLAPDTYQVFLHPDDCVRLGNEQDRAEIEQELASHLMATVQQIGATLTRRPEVHLSPSDQVRPHQVEVRAYLTTSQALAEFPPDTQEFDTQKAKEHTPEERSRAHHLLLGDRRFSLTTLSVSLGRGLDNDVVIEHPRVSRYHAQLRRRDGQWWLIDLGSANGTTVNDQPVSEAVMQPGDVISLAGFEVHFRLQAPKDQ